jgi:hypothetical protein
MSETGGPLGDGFSLKPELPGRILARFLAFTALLVPVAARADWVREWRAELWHARHGRRVLRAARFDYLSVAWGLVADALWLRLDSLRRSLSGSAGLCLSVLLFDCLVCAGVVLIQAGSWGSFAQVLRGHLAGGYGFVVVPALIAAVATYPVRAMRPDLSEAPGWLSARLRWNLFLAAKLMLTLGLGFLGTAVAMGPVRVLLSHSALWAADWVELLLSAVVVSAVLRWALLNQEQRCQRCLRLLHGPTRVGRASRNFLDWNGTELVCAEGHGKLHVAEMQGSWCWYDLWLELDSGWQGILGA